MVAETQTRPMTADDLLQMPDGANAPFANGRRAADGIRHAGSGRCDSGLAAGGEGYIPAEGGRWRAVNTAFRLPAACGAVIMLS